MKDLGLQTLYIRRKHFLSTLMYMYRCIKGNAQVRFTNELIMTADTHDCNTRASTSGILQYQSHPLNFLGTCLDIKGLHCGLACHPISNMSQMLITSSASIRSSSKLIACRGFQIYSCFRNLLACPFFQAFNAYSFQELYDDLCVLLDT